MLTQIVPVFALVTLTSKYRWVMAMLRNGLTNQVNRHIMSTENSVLLCTLKFEHDSQMSLCRIEFAEKFDTFTCSLKKTYLRFYLFRVCPKTLLQSMWVSVKV